MAEPGIVPEQTVVTIELGGKPYVVHHGRVAGTGLQAAARAAPLICHLHADGKNKVEKKKSDADADDITKVTFRGRGGESVGSKSEQNHSAADYQIRFDECEQKHRSRDHEREQNDEGCYGCSKKDKYLLSYGYR